VERTDNIMGIKDCGKRRKIGELTYEREEKY
jgi:hypothetical protein